MKNIKKLVSSILAVTLLAGSAVSMSCSAWFGNKKSEEKKGDVKTMEGEPGAIDEYNKSHPDSYYRVKDQIKKLREQLNRLGNEEGKEKLIEELNKIEENVEARRDLNNPSCKSLIKENIEKILNSIKNKAISYGLKALIISGLFVLCSILGVSGMWALLKGAWWVLSFLPKSVLTGLGVYAGKKLL